MGGSACSTFDDGRRVDFIAKLKRADTLHTLDPTVVDGSTNAYLNARDAFTEVIGGVRKAESESTTLTAPPPTRSHLAVPHHHQGAAGPYSGLSVCATGALCCAVPSSVSGASRVAV